MISLRVSSVVSLSSFFFVKASLILLPALGCGTVVPDANRKPVADGFSARDAFESMRERMVELLETRGLILDNVDFVGVASVDVALLLGAGEVLNVRVEDDDADFVGTFFSSSVRFAFIAGIETFFAKVDAVGLADGTVGTLSRGVRGERVIVVGEVDMFRCWIAFGVRRPGELLGVAAGVLLTSGFWLGVDTVLSLTSVSEATLVCLDTACLASPSLGLIEADLGSGVLAPVRNDDLGGAATALAE